MQETYHDSYSGRPKKHVEEAIGGRRKSATFLQLGKRTYYLLSAQLLNLTQEQRQKLVDSTTRVIHFRRCRNISKVSRLRRCLPVATMSRWSLAAAFSMSIFRSFLLLSATLQCCALLLNQPHVVISFFPGKMKKGGLGKAMSRARFRGKDRRSQPVRLPCILFDGSGAF